MGAFSIWHWLIVLAVVLLLFGGRGKISQLMGDIGKGLKSFKKNVKDEGADAEDESGVSARIADESDGDEKSASGAAKKTRSA